MIIILVGAYIGGGAVDIIEIAFSSTLSCLLNDFVACVLKDPFVGCAGVHFLLKHLHCY